MLDILKFGEVEIHRSTAPFSGGRQAVPRRLVGDQDRAAVRCVREDDARETDLSGPAAVPGRAAGTTVRRHRTHVVDADGRDGRSGRRAVRGAARAAEGRHARWRPLRRRGPRAPISSARSRTACSRWSPSCRRPTCPRSARRRAFESAGQTFAPGTFVIPPVPAAQKIVEHAARQLGPARARGRPRAGGRRLPVEARHARRSLPRRQQHARRLDDVAARAVRHQPPGRERAGLRRSRRQVRRHPARLRHHGSASSTAST